MPHTLKDRAENYHLVFPKYPPLMVTERWLYGIWMIGSYYKSRTGYYGEYPRSYLNRIHSLFSEKKRVLHLFSGTVEKGRWEREWTLDMNEALKPDLVVDVSQPGWYEEVLESVDEPFDLILADPPYSEEDAKHYGTCLVGRNKVVRDCKHLIVPGGHLVWLDQVLPMYRKVDWLLVGTIGIVRSTNHRFRIVCIWGKNRK